MAGRDAAVSWLAELPALHAAWEHYLVDLVAPVHASGRRPADFYEGFMDVLDAPDLQEVLSSLRADAPDPDSRYGGSAPLLDRITRLRQRPADDVPDDLSSALELLEDPVGTLHALQGAVHGDPALEAAPWRELGNRHAATGTRAARA